MGHFCIDEFFIDGKLRCHHVIVGGCEDSLRAGGEQGVRRKGDFPVVCTRLFHHSDAFFLTVSFGGSDGGGGGILTLVIEKSHCLEIRVCG